MEHGFTISHQLFSQHLKTGDDRLELRVILDIWEIRVQIPLREAGDDADDRAEAVVDAVHTVWRRNQVSAFCSSVNICVGTFGWLGPMKKLAISWVIGEPARSASAAYASVALP